MAFAPYTGTFEQFMNEACSPKNIATTAARFVEMERQAGGYAFGQFVKNFLPNPGEFVNWEKDAGAIAEPIRKRLSSIISTNLKSASPLPMMLKVGENVDDTHDVLVKTFAYGGHIYIGIHMLCPNTALPMK